MIRQLSEQRSIPTCILFLYMVFKQGFPWPIACYIKPWSAKLTNLRHCINKTLKALPRNKTASRKNNFFVFMYVQLFPCLTARERFAAKFWLAVYNLDTPSRHTPTRNNTCEIFTWRNHSPRMYCHIRLYRLQRTYLGRWLRTHYKFIEGFFYSKSLYALLPGVVATNTENEWLM